MAQTLSLILDGRDIYNELTTQIIAFDPEQLKLDMFFRTTDVDLPTDPDFIRVPIDFGESEGTQPDTHRLPEGHRFRNHPLDLGHVWRALGS